MEDSIQEYRGMNRKKETRIELDWKFPNFLSTFPLDSQFINGFSSFLEGLSALHIENDISNFVSVLKLQMCEAVKNLFIVS